jgi:hypothetical protein
VPLRLFPPILQPLEPRTFLSSVTFAVIGDFGQAGQGELDVANRVKSWNPAFIATVGDNNYPSGAPGTIDTNVGQYYSSFIYPYLGAHGAGSPDGVNHFFPALGNHEWSATGAQPHLDYFTLPGNERYYTVTQGPVQLFILDSDSHEPDLKYVNNSTNTQNSPEGQWLKANLAASSAPWKLVLFHHSPFTSGEHGNSAWMQWPFQQWGASAVISGHDHDYERIMKNGLPYLVDGLGGAEIRKFATSVVSGSAARFTGDYGALKASATDTTLTFQFITREGSVIDTYTLDKNAPPPPPPPSTGVPAAPIALVASSASSSSITLTWTDNATNESAYKIERSTDGKTFYPLAAGGVNATHYLNTALSAGKRYYYRVYAINSAGRSTFSNVASAVPGSTTTNPPPPPPQPPGGTSTPAAPSGLAALAAGSSSITLTWQDNATNETGYQIERSTDGKTFYRLAGGGANATHYLNTNLSPGKRYYYRAYAVNAAGRSPYGNVASAVTPAAAAAPQPAPLFSTRALRHDEAVWS